MQRITGQLFVRDVGDQQHRVHGGRLVMVVGVLAVPSEFLQSERQYTVTGMTLDPSSAQLVIDGRTGKDISEQSQGTSPTGLLRLPIWRV